MSSLSYLSKNVSRHNLCNSSPNSNKNQHCKETFLLHPGITEALEDFLKDLTSSERLVMDWLFWFDRRCVRTEISQAGLARRVGVSRQYVNLILSRMQAVGIISKQYRHMRTCIYRVSSYFRNPFITQRLASYFNVFKLQSLLLTQSNKNLNRYISLSTVRGNGNRRRAVVASPFSNYLESIAGELRLTTAGKVRLCAFPDRALEHVLDCYRKKKKTLEGDYGRWLWGCANEYCKQLSLTPNWHYSNQLAYQLDVDIDAQLTTQKLPALTKTPSFSAEPVPPRAASHKVWRKLEERTPEDPAILQEKIAQKLADPNLPPFQRMLLEKLVPPKTHIKNGSHQNKKV